jgi:two-component system, chemotaxis family, chemotaxis protein CheY
MSRQRRVLVVDDERGIQMVLQEILDLEGYAVRIASNGQEALDILEEWMPDVIVLDLMMPVMDGSAFREAQLGLTDRIGSIPIVTLSGARDAVERANAMGAAAVILKPFDLDEVVTTVGRVIEDHSG